ncbi:MAG: universal stress protein [Gillisia sp.]
MEKIIYATNFSKDSVAALKYSYGIRKLFNAEVIVLHVFDAGSDQDGKIKIIDKRRELEDFCSLNLGEKYDDLDLSVSIINGSDVVSEIINFVRDLDVRLLLMGACKPNPLNELLLLDTTKEMISKAPFPVLAVPHEFQFTIPEKILYTTDFDEEDVYHILELTKILTPFSAQITVLHVSDEKEEKTNSLLISFKELIAEKVNYEKLHYKIIYSHDIVDSLKTYVEEADIDMVAMLERGKKTDLTKIFHRDLVKRMQACLKVPLLSFKKKY